MILRGENFFSPERGSKVVKYAKNDRLDTLIVLAKDERILFFDLKGGPFDDFAKLSLNSI